MSRTKTVWNPKHPLNMIHAQGQRAKAAARNLSNKELDAIISENTKDATALNEVLAWPRHRKIKFLKFCAMNNFADVLEQAKKSNELQPTGDKPNAEK